MLTFLYVISYLFIGAISYACVAGAVHIARALRSGDRAKAKSISFSLLRISLVLAGLIVIVATHGRGMKVAQSLLMIMMLLGLPKAVRVLSGNDIPTEPLP